MHPDHQEETCLGRGDEEPRSDLSVAKGVRKIFLPKGQGENANPSHPEICLPFPKVKKRVFRNGRCFCAMSSGQAVSTGRDKLAFILKVWFVFFLLGCTIQSCHGAVKDLASFYSFQLVYLSPFFCFHNKNPETK